jgi:copper chaperone CopZ
MKKLSIIALSAVVGLGASLGSFAPASAAEEVASTEATGRELPAGQDRVMIPVAGMTCGGCAASINREVKKLDGILDIEVDHLKGAVTVVRVTNHVTVDQIVEAINKTGFKASKPRKS